MKTNTRRFLLFVFVCMCRFFVLFLVCVCIVCVCFYFSFCVPQPPSFIKKNTKMCLYVFMVALLFSFHFILFCYYLCCSLWCCFVV